MNISQLIPTITLAATQPGAKSEQVPFHKSVRSKVPPYNHIQSAQSSYHWIIFIVM